jgi:hypothetical protein
MDRANYFDTGWGNYPNMGIGVTEFISKPEIRDRIRRDFPNPGTDVEGEIRVTHSSDQHSLLGQAFDYLIRIWLETNCETVYDPHTHLLRLDADWTFSMDYTPSRYAEGYDPEKAREYTIDEDKYNRALERARKKREQFNKTGMNVNNAIDAALVYSGLDHNVGFDDGTLQANSFEEKVVTELQELFHNLREQDSLIKQSVIISPVFGERSFILEGHADFIIDDVLIDVKVTEDPAFKPGYWRQLLAYYMLNDIHRELQAAEIDSYGSDVPYPELSKVGVYFARYGELQTIDVENYLQPQEEYERLRAFFVDRAIKVNKDDRRNYDDYRALLTDPYDFEDQTTLGDF